MFELINRTDGFHLYYLITNDIRNDIFSGISHVAEHTLLLPIKEEIHFVGKGYTGINHVCLNFSCSSLEALQEIDRGIIHGDIITEKNVDCAKYQVSQELRRLEVATKENEELIKFVTDGRIHNFPMGDIKQIEEIQANDVHKWFADNRQRRNIYKFIFQDAHEMVYATPILPTNLTNKVADIECTNYDIGHDAVLRFTPYRRSTLIQLYVRIPALYKKEELVKKAVFECCIQRKIKNVLGINVKMFDKFFGGDERFAVMGFLWSDSLEINDLLSMVRHIIMEIDEVDFIQCRESFAEMASLIMRQNESNFEIINTLKNQILYNSPKIQKTDLSIIQHIDYNSFRKEKIARMPIKVVIK